MSALEKLSRKSPPLVALLHDAHEHDGCEFRDYAWLILLNNGQGVFMKTLCTYFILAIGGVIGAMARYGISLAALSYLSSAEPS